jgi:hypothetical protein
VRLHRANIAPKPGIYLIPGHLVFGHCHALLASGMPGPSITVLERFRRWQYEIARS